MIYATSFWADGATGGAPPVTPRRQAHGRSYMRAAMIGARAVLWWVLYWTSTRNG